MQCVERTIRPDRSAPGYSQLRGTAWLTTDTDTTTKVSVKQGAVLVRDFVTRRSVLVTAGHSYTARERRATARRVPAFTGRA